MTAGIPLILKENPTNPRNRYFQINRAGHYRWNDLPDATSSYAENVLEALANLWIKRTDTDDLRHSAAQSKASKRLSEEESRIQILVVKLDEVRAELDASQERATVYRKSRGVGGIRTWPREMKRVIPAELGGGSQSSDGEGMALVDRDKAILAARVAAFDPTEGPRVGYYVRFADGVTRRISYVRRDRFGGVAAKAVSPQTGSWDSCA